MKKAWTWLKRWGLAIAGALAVVLGAGWLWHRRSTALGRVTDKLAVEKARTQIAELQGMRTMLTERLDEKDEAIRTIDEQLAENKRRIVEAHEYGEGMTDAEIEEAFKRLLSQ
jgi:hypothetical protein